jgi:dynein light chain LC8-type
MEELAVNIKSSDMPEDVQAAAVEAAKSVRRPPTPRPRRRPHPNPHLAATSPPPRRHLATQPPPRRAHATQAVSKFTLEKDVAAHVKKEMDARFGPTWHCVVGRHFGSYVTHETRSFAYFYLGPLAVLLFKSG